MSAWTNIGYSTLKNGALVALICAAVCLFSAGAGFSQEGNRSFTGHFLYGKMAIENNDPDVGGGDYEISLLAVDAQKPLNLGIFQYGLETGVLFSLDSSLRQFSASSGSGGGTANVSVDISSILIDFFFGGYVGLVPAKWLRLYVGAGPLLIWGGREAKPEDPNPEVLTDESEYGLGAGLYARAGIDIFFTDYLGLNAGARLTRTTLSFEETAGSVDIEGWQYYAGLAFHF